MTIKMKINGLIDSGACARVCKTCSRLGVILSGLSQLLDQMGGTDRSQTDTEPLGQIKSTHMTTYKNTITNRTTRDPRTNCELSTLYSYSISVIKRSGENSGNAHVSSHSKVSLMHMYVHVYNAWNMKRQIYM